ncbi:MAG: DUF1015 domain-containing protein [Vicinamibacteria bacterium]|nr:DUF1015 domain-containing protein [Vicinamibacteria bacterium]
MTDIRPFRALRFPASVGSLEALLAPPYDVISEADRKTLLDRHERNVVRVILKDPADGDQGYERIAQTFGRWRSDGTLVQDREAAIYLLEQRFSWEGRGFVRIGILARFKVEPEGSPVIRPHEKTRGPAKEDRFSVLKATGSNFSPIFLFFEDKGAFAKAARQAKEAHEILATYIDDDGVTHTMWAITEEEVVEALAASAGGGPSYIADGHHRYATAQRYVKEVGPEGASTYGYFCPNDSGLLVLPYHRILFGAPSPSEVMTRLRGRYLLESVNSPERAAREVANSTLPFAFAICWPDGKAVVCESAPGVEDELPKEAAKCLKDLDTYFLHQVGFKHLGIEDPRVEFVHSLADAKRELQTHEDAVAILMRATPLRHIEAVADASESMPPKSTFFHPKIPSGILIHPLEAEA